MTHIRKREASHRITPVVFVIEAPPGRYLAALQRAASRDERRSLILHDNGQWQPINHASAAFARRHTVPRIVSPRGMQSPWARNHRKWKKRIAWSLYARRDLAQAQVIHATSELEARELRDLGVRQPIAILPNGVDPMQPPADDVAAPSRPYLLFLGRIHRKKGVRELLRAWRSLDTPDWDLILAGPDEEGIIACEPLPYGVRYLGPVYGELKRQLLQQASLFVLPSYSENFGVVVAEALMAGVPVITTHGTPWERLHTEGCGWWIPMEEECLRDTLGAAMARSLEELKAMGARGRGFAMTAFAWPSIASQMAAVYTWVLGDTSCPTCVDRG